jgi:hypothetical protein
MNQQRMAAADELALTEQWENRFLELEMSWAAKQREWNDREQG